jgi:hypothetical protein
MRQTILDALIEEGPHKGLTLGECMLLGHVIDGEVVDRAWLERLHQKQKQEVKSR